nr:hypothetical protein PJ912_06465 [Pectobacterium colocasium]
MKEYAKAASAGDTESRLAYGEMLRLGQGGKEDYVEAMKQYRLAANDGNRMAQYRMGMMRQDGLGHPAIVFMPTPGMPWRRRRG